ncbi:glycoside hydrolase family 25 protein [Streptomyces tremellae]|uniref:Lysozyme n=1 Tax=Streptomyces tremellae TaxID=1124239 RepID=A0ABP7EYA2_9ACTN
MATSRGVDVSAYQPAQNWAVHKSDGVVFAFAKASEGLHTHDTRFATHITGIKKAGLVPGAYHFAWPNQDAAAEAANYVSAVRPYAGAGFCHWLDLERYSDGRNYAGRSAAQINAYVTAWLAAVRKAFPGQRVGVYTSGDDLAKGHVPAGVPLWYPAYTWGTSSVAYATAEAHAQPRPSGRAPLIWQFTSTPIDRSVCYLTPAQLREWAAGDDTTKDTDMQLADAVTIPAWVKSEWAKDSGLADGKIAVNTALASTYGHARATHDATTQILAQLKAQSAAITTLAGLVGKSVDTAAVVAAVQKAIADAVVHVEVTGTSQT